MVDPRPLQESNIRSTKLTCSSTDLPDETVEWANELQAYWQSQLHTNQIQRNNIRIYIIAVVVRTLRFGQKFAPLLVIPTMVLPFAAAHCAFKASYSLESYVANPEQLSLSCGLVLR